MLRGRTLLGLLLFLVSSACGPAVQQVRIEENASGQVAGRGVGLGPVVPHQQFSQGKRVTVLRATLFVTEGTARRKQVVSEGDDLMIGTERWLVVQVVQGGADTRGVIVLQPAPP